MRSIAKQLLAAPSHTSKLHSVTSRAIRRDVELRNSFDMMTIRSVFAEVATRARILVSRSDALEGSPPRTGRCYREFERSRKSVCAVGEALDRGDALA